MNHLRKEIFKDGLSCRTGLLGCAVVLTMGGCGGGGGVGSSLNTVTSAPAGNSTYSIGGTITGLTAAGLVLQNNAGDTLSLKATASSFTFPTPVAAGGAYNVTLQTQPSGETCTVTGGSGAASADVVGVVVACSPSVAAAPAAELRALATAWTAIEFLSATADLAAMTSGVAPCLSGGSVSVNQSTHLATYTNCSTAFQPENSYSGTLDAGILGSIQSTNSGALLKISNYAVTIQNSAPLATKFTLGGGTFWNSEALSAGVLSGTFAAGSLDALNVQVGQSSQYKLSTVTIGSPVEFSRTIANNVVTHNFPQFSAAVTFNTSPQLVINSASPLIWQGAGYPVSGSLSISDSASPLLATVVFSSNGQFKITGVMANQVLNETKSWTDADVQAAIKYATQ